MTEQEKEILECAKKIKEYCENVAECGNCIFDGYSCILCDYGIAPIDWRLEEIE